ncbi:MAG TPA: hypothetical protein DCY20_02670 [Firmicutes bacterium]|nr:hypothetical protein [Bacillota bacterium]
MKKILEPMLGFSFVGLVLLLIFSFIAMIGGGIMKLFGLQYDSLLHLLLFFIVTAGIGFPIEAFAGALPKVLREAGFIQHKLYVVLFVILDTMSTYFVVSLVDHFMDSVQATELAIFIYAFVFAIASVLNNDDDKESDSSH